MILTVPLWQGTPLANVRYRWIVGGVEGAELSTGVTQPDATRSVFRFDVQVPDNAEEMVVYSSTDPANNWNVAQYKLAAAATQILPVGGEPAPPINWQILTTDDILSEFTPSELAAIATLMGTGTPYTAKLQQIVSRTIAEIRGYISGGGYPLDPNPSAIPLSLFPDGIALARWRFLVSAPQLKQLQTEERKGLYTDALTKLGKIADMKFNVEPPGSPDPPPFTLSGTWNSEGKMIMRTHSAYANADAPADA